MRQQTPLDLLLQRTFQAEQRHFWFRGFRQFVAPILAAAAATRPNPVLLDCGCGTGANLALLARLGTAYGVDLSWVGLSHAQRYGHRRLARADVSSLPFGDGCIDVVTSFDVIYSLEEAAEEQAVAEAYRVLRPGGWAIVHVAALPILRGHHSILSHERRRYRPARLRSVLEGAGFAIDRLTYTHALICPLLLAVRLSQRLSGSRSPEDATSEITVPPAPINTLLSWLVGLEALALRWTNLPIGSSLLCTALKPSNEARSAAVGNGSLQAGTITSG